MANSSASSRLSERARQLSESMTLAISARANELRLEGVDVVSFGAGESDFPPPPAAVRGAREALAEGFARYTPTSGILPLKRQIANSYEARGYAPFESSEVVVTVGGKQALYNAFQVLCNPGDEVLIPVPYWTSYVEMVRLAGATPTLVPPDAELNIDLDALEAAITERSRVLVINSPSNPSGVVLGDDQLSRLAEIVRAHDLFVISDEIYEFLTYGRTHKSLVLDFDLRDRGLVVSGASKTLAITGWRIGYALGPVDVIQAMARLQGHSTSCANSLAQRGVLSALLDNLQPLIAEMVTEYDKRRMYMISRLREMPGLSVIEPYGAFYAFPKVNRHFGKTAAGGQSITDSISFSRALLETQSVALVPGAAFGADDHVRLSYATSVDEIEKGLDRLDEFLRDLT